MESNNSINYDNTITNHKNGKDDFMENNHVNGLTNGYNNDKSSKSHKSDHHKDKHKDRDKHRSKDHKSSSSSSNKDKDKHRHSSHHKSSSKDKDRREDRHKDKKSGERSEKSSKERSDKERSERSDRERSDRDKDRGDKEKSKSDKDRERSEKHRDEKKNKDKEHKSSKDKDKSRDKEGRDKDKHRHSSSRDKHSSKDKHRDKDKHSSSSSKDKREKEKKVESYESEPARMKEKERMYDDGKDDSLDEDEQRLVIREETESHNDDEEQNNISQASSCDYNLSQFRDEPREDMREEPEEEQDTDEDIPLRKPFSHKHRLASRLDNSKRRIESEGEEDDAPLAARKKIKKKKEKKSKKRNSNYEDEFVVNRDKKQNKRKVNNIEETSDSPTKKKKKQDEEQEVWKWWEEEKKESGKKWTYLEHKGPVFAPAYERLPDNVKFYYDGHEMRLSNDTEEVAGFYARMLDHDYTTKDIFNTNFFKDWRKVMNDKERSKITDLKKCNFKAMHTYYLDVSEKNRNRTKEEKADLKSKNEAIIKEYGFCVIDGHKEKIGNFKIEPPGLFRGRGEHPKMGKLKKRIQPEDVLINCSKDSKIPKPPSGHKWKEVRHDNTVTWLASWTESVQNQAKYVMLNPSSKLKGEKDWQKYETARRLHKSIDKIRTEYREDWKSKEMRIRQRAVALYFIDKLALRAGNEKDEDQADTVGCCSLRVEHIQLHETKDDRDYVVVFDFLGKDSIRYYNEVPVEKRVFKNLQLFMENKAPGDDLFDRLNTTIMNKHLNELMEGLTAKVFRTYNASFTLQQQLEELTNPDDTVSEKILSYNRANRAVAILCNHQRSVPKGHEKSMEKLKEKIQTKKDQIHDAERQAKDAQKDAKRGSVKEKVIYDKKKKTLQRLKEQLMKLTVQETDRDENKTIALGTSKLNYLDPRISVAWCKKYGVPIEKIYNKTQRDKFRWAIDMAGPDYVF